REAQRVGFRMGGGLWVSELRAAGIRIVDRGLELIRGLLVALGVLARHGDRTRQLFLAAERVLERVVGGRGDLLADEEGERRQRDDGRAQSALPPPTSPAVPGSHSRRMVP